MEGLAENEWRWGKTFRKKRRHFTPTAWSDAKTGEILKNVRVPELISLSHIRYRPQTHNHCSAEPCRFAGALHLPVPVHLRTPSLWVLHRAPADSRSLIRWLFALELLYYLCHNTSARSQPSPRLNPSSQFCNRPTHRWRTASKSTVHFPRGGSHRGSLSCFTSGLPGYRYHLTNIIYGSYFISAARGKRDSKRCLLLGQTILSKGSFLHPGPYISPTVTWKIALSLSLSAFYRANSLFLMQNSSDASARPMRTVLLMQNPVVMQKTAITLF